MESRRKKNLSWLLIVLLLTAGTYFFVKPKIAAALLVTKAQEYLDNKDLPNALATFSQAIIEDPKSKDAYIGRAKAYIFSQQPDAALADINSTMKLGVDTEEIHLLRGITFASKGVHRLAISEYSQLLYRNPTNVLAILNTGRSYDRLNEPTNAVEAYKKFVQTAPPDDPSMEEAKKLLAAAEKKAAQRDSNWKVVATSTSRQDFVNFPSKRFSLTYVTPDGSKKDIIDLDFGEQGWKTGAIQNNHYLFIRENETVQNPIQRLTATFVTAEKDLTISQFMKNFVEPSRVKGNIRINILSSTNEEAYVELVGGNGYSLTRIIKGTASIIVLSYATQNQTEERKDFSSRVLNKAIYLNQLPPSFPDGVRRPQ